MCLYSTQCHALKPRQKLKTLIKNNHTVYTQAKIDGWPAGFIAEVLGSKFYSSESQTIYFGLELGFLLKNHVK